MFMSSSFYSELKELLNIKYLFRFKYFITQKGNHIKDNSTYSYHVFHTRSSRTSQRASCMVLKPGPVSFEKSSDRVYVDFKNEKVKNVRYIGE